MHALVQEKEVRKQNKKSSRIHAATTIEKKENWKV